MSKFTPAELRIVNINRRISYKPHYRVNIAVCPERTNYWVTVVYPEIDTLTGEKRSFHFSADIGPKTVVDAMSELDILATIRKHVHLMEQHEADEWLKLDNNIVFDPHKEIL